MWLTTEQSTRRRDDPHPVAIANTTLAPPSGQVTLLPPGVWEIEPERSRVGFEVRHLKIARVRGHFGELDASIRGDEAGVTTISARVAVASIDTGDARRDERLRASDFFDVEHHPLLSFEGICRPAAAGAQLVVVGRMSIRGVSRPLELLTARPEPQRGARGNAWRVTARGVVSRREFGLEWDSAFAAGGLVIDDRIALRLDVTLAEPQ